VVVRHAGACRVQEVRSDLGITVGAASKLVDRLERDGLAVRRANPDDRRSSLIELTRDGLRALERGVVVMQDGLTEHLDGESDVAAVTSLLERLDSRLRSGAEAVSS
jgi:DNA-binding MarR family transcriptional regulator